MRKISKNSKAIILIAILIIAALAVNFYTTQKPVTQASEDQEEFVFICDKEGGGFEVTDITGAVLYESDRDIGLADTLSAKTEATDVAKASPIKPFLGKCLRFAGPILAADFLLDAVALTNTERIYASMYQYLRQCEEGVSAISFIRGEIKFLWDHENGIILGYLFGESPPPTEDEFKEFIRQIRSHCPDLTETIASDDGDFNEAVMTQYGISVRQFTNIILAEEEMLHEIGERVMEALEDDVVQNNYNNIRDDVESIVELIKETTLRIKEDLEFLSPDAKSKARSWRQAVKDFYQAYRSFEDDFRRHHIIDGSILPKIDNIRSKTEALLLELELEELKHAIEQEEALGDFNEEAISDAEGDLRASQEKIQEHVKEDLPPALALLEDIQGAITEQELVVAEKLKEYQEALQEQERFERIFPPSPSPFSADPIGPEVAETEGNYRDAVRDLDELLSQERSQIELILDLIELGLGAFRERARGQLETLKQTLLRRQRQIEALERIIREATETP